jgi:UDPglucose 6-dehydrogenase
VSTVGIIGLGKLGLPTAATLALHHITIYGYDRDSSRMSLSALSGAELGRNGSGTLREEVMGFEHHLHFASLEELIEHSDCILVAVETPHGPLFEGTTPLPMSRQDFDYSALTAVLETLFAAGRPDVPIGIISTVLPGTIRRLLEPYGAERSVVYCPQFIAMGSVSRDLINPEFVLLGTNGTPSGILREVFSRLSSAPVYEVTYETAELAKVLYNTVISAKVAIANLVQVLASETDANAADVLSILRAANRRLASPAYLGAGMGDGGPCHPRDNIALSWLVRRVGFSADLFTSVMEVREAYVEWLGRLWLRAAAGLPLILLGTAYKQGTDITTGSSAVLLLSLLQASGIQVSTVVDEKELTRELDLIGPACLFVGTPEDSFIDYDFPPGSVVVDPWHRVPRREDLTVLHVGVPAA